MVADSLDVPYPVIDQEKCIDCGLCLKACPNNNSLDFHETRQVLAAWSLDDETRRRSASGGVAAELYRYAIENNWYTCGVTINRHSSSFRELKTIEDIDNVRNSKYVFSDTLDFYKKIQEKLKTGQTALFIGLPCQVAGLYCFLGKTHPNLITVDLVCHGIVPEEYLRQHIEQMERNTGRKTTQIFFRNPDLHTYTYTFTLGDHDGIFYKRQAYEDDVYQLGYHNALTYRENCYHCQFAQQKRIGDLTLCDFSAIGQIVPVHYNRMNISCVLVNTDSGKEMISKLGDKIFWEQRPREEAFNYEPQLNHPYEKHPGRNRFVSEYKHTHDFEHAASKALTKELADYQRRYNPSLLRRIARKAKHQFLKFRMMAARLIRHPKVPFGAILMLHRINVPNTNGIWYNQHLKLSPQTFREMVKYAREQKCKFVSMDEMAEAIRRKKKVRRWIAVTLDDGYRDNYQNGADVFHSLNVPYTIYVCTKLVEGRMLYWWEILEQLVLSQEHITLNDGRTFNCTTKEEKELAFLEIREIIIKLPQDNLEEHLKQLFVNYDIDCQYGNQDLGLTWEQIRELGKEPLATIGNHTYSHKAFTGCTDEEICADINQADTEMLNKTGIKMQHFAFPFGEAIAVSAHDIELAKLLGFKTSATTKEEFVRYNTNPLDLPRLFVTEKNWKQVIDRIVECC